MTRPTLVACGKAIDTCKALARSMNLPFFAFPTIASTCAPCTSLGIIISTGFVSNFVQVG